MPDIRDTLVHAVTQYDLKESKKPTYNSYALAHYIARIDDIMRDIEAGADTREAIVAGFTGRLLNTCLRSLKLPKPSQDEMQGMWSLVYHPVKNHS
jgi:hypothetical protein